MANGDYEAFLFDWRGTLVHDPPNEWWVSRALTRIGRAASESVVAGFCEQLTHASRTAAVIEAQASADRSAALHAEASMLLFRAAGLDDELADSLYALDREPASHAFYVDAAGTLRRLHEIGGRLAVVSDIHFDLRPEFEAAAIADYVDAFVLSFEHGVQKPDPRIFQLALDALGVAASRTLMIGDRASRDGGAVALGITTLLLPPVETASEPRGLRHALALARVDA